MLATVLRRLKTVKVGHRITDSAVAGWICGDGPAVARLRYGAKAVVFVGDYMGRAMYLWGEHDPRITDVMDAVLRPGETVLDIGANFGVTGLFAAKKVGPTGKVHLFEPQPLVAQCLRTSLLINGYAHAQVHECALSDHSGFADMAVVDPTNMGMTTLAPQNGSAPAGKLRVRLEDAGEYVRALGCSRVPLVKLDVEGHEGIILESMRGWLAEARPGAVLFECHLGSGGFWAEQTVQVLSGLGYEFLSYDLTKLWVTRLYKIGAQTSHPAGYDFVAIHPASEAAERLRPLIEID